MLEVLELQDQGEWVTARTAWNETLAIPFSFHKSVRDGMREPEFMDYLARQAQAMVEQFGDARNWPYRGEREIEGDFN